MDISEAGLDRIEAQRSTDVSHDQRRKKSFCMNLINNGARTLSSRGLLQYGEREGTESVPEFFINLKLSDFFDLPGEYVLMNVEMFTALDDGEKEWLEKSRSHGTPLACLKSDRGDSILHLAVVSASLEIVKSIVSEFPCLLLEPNTNDQLPLHVAARAGHSDVVEALVRTLTFVSATLSEEEKERLNLYVVKDKDGDTPLHLALKGRFMEIASSLVKENLQASFLANKNGISPLYLAVEAGDVSLVKAMLRISGNDVSQGRKFDLDSQLQGRKYLAHAALKLTSTEILDVILKECPSLKDERDEEGRTCLSFGASMGYYEGVCNLLDRSTKSVYVSDDGSYPIHMAVEKGHKKIVEEILKRCPNSKHLLNKRGQNILHIAANCGRFQILNHLTTHEQTKHLANEQDVDGNTPLHLATIKWRPRAARCLVGQENLFIQNNSGLTALDIAELNIKPNYIFRERLTIVVLVHGHFENDPKCIQTMDLTRPTVPLDRGGNKEYINALIVVAALVATVTFSAGFTTPGGFKSTSSPNLGVATLANDRRLHVFLACDTIAMGSSVIAVVSLIWAQLGDPALFRSSVNLALPLLCFSLMWMANAYFSAMMLTVGPVPGFMIFTVLAYLIFLYVMLVILVPHIFLQLLRFGPSPAVSAVFLSYLKLVNDDNDESYPTSSTQSHMSIKKAESVEISGERPHTI